METYFKIRKYGHGDAAHAVSLYARIAAKDSTINAISREDWDRFILLPQNKRGEGFRLAVLSNDSAVGISMSSLRDHSEDHIRHFRILVESTHRRHGIGASLLRGTAEIEKEVSGALQTVCPDEWTAAIRFYERLTFTVVDHELEMVLALSDIRQLTAKNSRWLVREDILSAELSSALADIHNEAYADSRSFVRVNAQTFPNLLSARAHLWVARDGVEVIGYCHLEDAEPDRSIESVAVKRSYRRRQVATA
jgi:GNAT superfamily N-acetyltransferase